MPAYQFAIFFFFFFAAYNKDQHLKNTQYVQNVVNDQSAEEKANNLFSFC